MIPGEDRAYTKGRLLPALRHFRVAIFPGQQSRYLRNPCRGYISRPARKIGFRSRYLAQKAARNAASPKRKHAMKLGILSVAATVALTMSTSAARAQQPLYPVQQGYPVQQPLAVVPSPTVVTAPPVVVARPVVVVPAPVYPAYGGITIARPGLSVNIGGVYPGYGYYGRPYYGYGHGYHHHHHHR